MKKVFLVLAAIIVFSCSKKDEFEKNLISSSNEEIIWNFKAFENDKYVFIGRQESFFKDYTYKSYNSNEESKRGIGTTPLFIEGKNQSKSKWLYNPTDSSFSIGDNLNYKVIKYNQDSIFLEGKGYDGKFLMVRLKK